MVAKAMKIQDIVVTIPAFPPVLPTQSKVGLVYFIFAGLLFLFFGVKALLFCVFVFVMYKQGEKP